MNHKDLLRAAAQKADAMFLLADKHSADVAAEDERSVLQALVMATFSADVSLFIQ